MKPLSASLEKWKADGDFFDYQQHQIFYKQEGKGPVLLLIHGFPTASWDWHKVCPSLSLQFHLLAPDMLGFGFSDKPRPYSYSIMDQADLIEELLRHLHIHQFHILAHDYGDTVAQELLARQANHRTAGEDVPAILSVCFLNGGLFPGVHRPRLIQKLLASPLGRFMTPFVGERSLRKTFKNIFGQNSQPSDESLSDFWQLVACNDGKQVIPLLIRYMAERRKHEQRWTGALKQTVIPMRLINGTADPISGQHLAAHYQQHVPLPDVILLEGIGHYPQVEAPEQVITYFSEFVNQHY